MKSFMLSLIITLSVWGCFAQNNVTIRGQVVDENINPIPYACIILSGSSLGVISNTDGYFRITLKNNSVNDSIRVSYIGYEPLLTSLGSLLENKLYKFVLKEKIFKLDEVVIKAETAKEIILKAAAKIPENYYTKAYYLDAFYRESLIEDSNYTQLSEASCSFYLDSLQNFNFEEGFYNYISDGWRTSNNLGFNFEDRFDNTYSVYKNDQVKIKYARSSENNSNSLVKFTLIGGPMARMGCDKVRYPIFFFDHKRIKYYNFEIKGILQFENSRVYKISMSKKRKRNKKVPLEGIIYIDTKSYAFVGFDYWLTKDHIKYLENSRLTRVVRGGIAFNQRKPIKDKYLRSGYKAKIRYYEIGNKWFLKSIHQESELIYYFTKEGTKTNVKAIYDLVINNVDTNNVSIFPKDSVFTFLSSNDLFDYPFRYNKKFWDEYNILLPTKLESKAISDLEKERPLEEQFENKNKYDPALKPPVANKSLSFTAIHNDTIYDEYAWMKNRGDSTVQEYLDLENHYTRNYYLPLIELNRSLFYEMKNRIPEEEDKSIPYKMGNYLYYTTENKNQNYPKLYRKKDTINAKEELILDIPKLAADNNYYIVAGFNISRDDKTLAYFEDVTGTGNFYYLFKNLATHKYYSDTLFNVGSLIWLKSNDAVIYTVRDSLRRVNQVNLHFLNTHQSSDKVLFYEQDKTKEVFIALTKSKNFIFLHNSNSKEQEIYICDLKDGSNEFKLFSENKSDFVVIPEHFKNDSTFYIITNKDAANWRLCNSPISSPLNLDNTIANKAQTFILTDYMVLKNHLILIEQRDLTQRIKVIDQSNNKSYYLTDTRDYCTIKLNRDNVDSDSIVYSVSSIGYPSITYSYNLNTKKKNIVKENKVVGFSPSKYRTDLIWATSDDGTKIPIFLFYNKKQTGRKSNYLILNAYGAYNSSLRYSLPQSYLSLIDRGFIYAEAFIRGGGELGKNWNNNGKLLNKLNSLNDFIACSQYLIEKEYTIPEKFIIEGGSAGGLVMGYAINEYPELYKGAILSHPFVDVLNTLLDTTITLTTLDWDEWGNPFKKKYYDYIKSYSPYDNIKTQNYPNLLFITGAKDEQVNYWEPAKMVAKLRSYKTDSNILLLKTYMSSGHGGIPGKYGYINEQAMKFAFILDVVNFNK